MLGPKECENEEEEEVIIDVIEAKDDSSLVIQATAAFQALH